MFSTKLKPLLPNLTFFVKYCARKAKPIPTVVPPQQFAFNEKPITPMIQIDKNLINEKQSHEIEEKEKIYNAYENNLRQKLKQQITKQLKFDPSYEGEDPTPTKLVNRPGKGVVWGLGGQLMLASKKVELEGLKDNLQEIIDFLQLNQVKNIYVHDFHKDNPERPQTNKRRYHILGTCYSTRHCWKTATQMRNAFNLHSGKSKLRRGGKKYDPIFATRSGGKDQEFSMVDYKQYSILLMTEQQRQAMDLEWKWNNEVPEETLDKYTKAKLNRKGRKNQFQDF